MVHDLQLENDVFFMGFHDEPINEMHKMNIIVCPSDNEPFGRVLIEAMAIKFYSDPTVQSHHHILIWSCLE